MDEETSSHLVKGWSKCNWEDYGISQPSMDQKTSWRADRLCSKCTKLFSKSLPTMKRKKRVLVLDSKKAASCRLCDILLDKFTPDGSSDKKITVGYWFERLPMLVFRLVFETFADKEGEPKRANIFLHPRNFLEGHSIPIGTVMPPFVTHLSDETDSAQSLRQAVDWLNQCINHHETCNLPMTDPDFLPTRLIHIEKTDAGLCICLRETKSIQMPIRYITLSHCWGNYVPCRLLESNYEEFLHEIPLYMLSRLFKEVVLFLGELGERYVWIDSLCIIQDSKSDWEKESKMMGSIYQSGLWNIAATGFGNVQTGVYHTKYPTKSRLFTRRRPSLLTPIGLHLKNDTGYLVDEGGTMKVKGEDYLLYDADLVREGIDFAPLNKRGWVVQERALSIRTLHFGRDQLFWECAELTASEVFPFGHIPHMETSDTKAFALGNLKELEEEFRLGQHQKLKQIEQERKIEETSSIGKGLSGLFITMPTGLPQVCSSETIEIAFPGKGPSKLRGISPSLRQWVRVVERYSACSLTFSTDKMIAIAGLATKLQEHLLCPYLAGLWRTDLEHQLIWKVTRACADVRIEKNRGPSWSWASVDGPILMARWDLLQETPVPRNQSITWYSFVEDASVVPASPILGEMGPIVTGTIIMTGVLLVVKLTTDVACNRSQRLAENYLEGETEFQCNIFWDNTELESRFGSSGKRALTRLPKYCGPASASGDAGPDSELFMMPVRITEDVIELTRENETEYESDWETILKGLLLTPVDKKTGEYQRVGLVEVRHDLFTPVASTEILDSAYYISQQRHHWYTIGIA